jgi:hypothetical protein
MNPFDIRVRRKLEEDNQGRGEGDEGGSDDDTINDRELCFFSLCSELPDLPIP